MKKRLVSILAAVVAAAPALLCLSAAPAFAQSKVKIAVLDLKEQGVDKALAQSATSLLAAELQKLDVFKIISRDDIRNMLQFEKDKQSVGCEADTACLAEIGGALGVEYTVNGSLAKIGDGYILTLALSNTKSASVENRTTENIAKQDQIVAAVAKNARILVSKILKGREGSLVLTVAEEGALVKVDGQAKGSTPIKGRLPLSWGPHLLEVEKTGFVTYTEDIAIPARQALAKSIALVPSNDFIERYEGSAKKMRVGAWLTTGLAVAGIATAVAFNQMSSTTENKFLADRSAYASGTIPANTTADKLLADMKDLSNKGSSQVFIARLGLGIGAAALALGTYFWVAGEDPHKYDNYRDVAPVSPAADAPAAAPAASPATPAAKPHSALELLEPRSRGGAQGFTMSAGAAPTPGGAAVLFAGHF